MSDGRPYPGSARPEPAPGGRKAARRAREAERTGGGAAERRPPWRRSQSADAAGPEPP